MPLLSRFSAFWRNLFRKARLEQELDEELRAYVELLAAEKIEQGMEESAARRAALLEVGGVEQVKEQVRDVRMGTAVESLWRDLRYGLRMLWKKPGFTLTAVLTLSLGIGANTAIFSVVNAVLLNPLPFPSPGRLMALGQTSPENRAALSQFSFRNFADLRDQSKAFEQLAAYYNSNLTLTGQGEAARLRVTVATASLFPMLGASPSLGRVFLPEEDNPGGGSAGRPAILSWDCWQRYFGGDPAVVGRAVTLNANTYTIVGVMPANFSFPVQAQPTEVWVSTALDAEKTGQGAIMVARGYRGWRVVGRLKDGVTVEQAQAEADVIASGLAAQFPEGNKDLGIKAVPLLESLVGNLRLTLLLLFGTVGVVLLIACVNVANLLLASTASRQHEINIRVALGASRWRIVRQLMTESLMLALAGGVLGAVLAMWGTDLIVSLSPEGITRIAETRLDARVLAFTALVSVLTGAVCGLAPALGVSRERLAEALKEGGRSSTGGLRRGHARRLLVVAEVSLALVLLVGAGLFVRTLMRLQTVALGFEPHHVLTMTVAKSPSPSGSPEQTGEFFRQLTERLKALPGVVNASVTWQFPLSGASAMSGLEIEGQHNEPGSLPMGVIHTAGPDYFRTMGIPVVQGREFTEHDDMNSAPVLIINETLAKKFFPGGAALGKHITPGFSTTGEYVPREIVGVVGDIKHQGLRGEAVPEFYFAQAQMPPPITTLVVRTAGDPRSLVGAIRNEIQSADKGAPVYSVRTAEEYLSLSVASTRFNMTLLVAFAAVALLLTAVGLYGVISFSVSQSTHEIGVRMALGAQRTDVLRMVVWQGMSLSLIGVLVGLAMSLSLTRVMASLLYGISVTDPLTYVGVSLLVTLVALVACLVPARRATKVDPMIALRYE
jgi:putative ABC transport system permease protein